MLLAVTSCDPSASGHPPGTGDRAPFFDLAEYVDAEVERLNGEPRLVTKTVTLNGRTETRELTDLDFAGDLRLFREANINRPAWADKYEVQTKELSAGHRVTTYVARDSSLTTQRLIVEEDRGVPVEVRITRKTGTVLSDGRGELTYVPRSGYTVRTVQDYRFGDDVDSEIRVTW